MDHETDKIVLKQSAMLAEANRIIEMQQEQIAELRRTRFARFNNEDCWVYLGDGTDNLHSLICPVVISPGQLRELIAMGNWKKIAERHAERIKEMAECIQYCVKQVPELATVPGVEAVLTMTNGVQV